MTPTEKAERARQEKDPVFNRRYGMRWGILQAKLSLARSLVTHLDLTLLSKKLQVLYKDVEASLGSLEHEAYKEEYVLNVTAFRKSVRARKTRKPRTK